jgi:hypothetical protein
MLSTGSLDVLTERKLVCSLSEKNLFAKRASAFDRYGN